MIYRKTGGGNALATVLRQRAFSPNGIATAYFFNARSRSRERKHFMPARATVRPTVRPPIARRRSR